MADGRVVIDTALNNKGFTRGVSGLKGELGGLTSVAKKLGAAIGVAFGVAALVNFGKKAVELGSNVAEVQNVVDVAFGDMAYKIEEFSKNSIQSFGMSRLAAKETASNFMAMGKSMGLSTEAASDMAVAATGLSGDVASFFNISQDLAKIRLRGIWTGETEALKELGVVMTETNLKEYALANGIEKSYDAMNQAERVTLRYRYVTDALSLASGDFIRTQDNWANQTRILSMQWEEFMSIMGQTLITVLRPLVVTLNSVVSAMIDTANAVNNVMTALFGGASTQMKQTQEDAGGVGDAIDGSVENQDDLTDSVKETNKAAKKSLAAFDEINKLAGDTQIGGDTELSPNTPSGGGVTEETEQIEGLSEKMKDMLESLKSGFQELKGWVMDFFAPFNESWDTHGAAVLESVRGAVSNILDLIRSIGAAFMNVWSNKTGVTILNTIQSIISKVFDIVGALAGRFKAAWEANNNGEAIWQAIMNIIQHVLDFVNRLASATLEWASGLDLEPIVSSFRRLLEALDPLVALVLDGLAWAYENILLPLASWVIEEAAPALIDLLTEAIKALTPVIEALKPWGVWLWENLLKPLGQWTGETVINAIQWITEKLRAFSDWARENPEDVRTIAGIILAFLGGLVTYYTVKKVCDAIENIGASIQRLPEIIRAFDAVLTSPAFKVAALAFAFGLLAVGIANLAGQWDTLSGGERALTILASALLAAAAAWAAFHISATMGIAAAAIVGGLALIGLTGLFSKGKANAPSSSSALKAPSTASAMNLRGVPHLAKGAVIPANREFLAVLGDQRSGTNVEAPLSTIEEAVGRAMDQRGGSAQNIEITVRFEGTLAQMARLMKPHIDAEGKRVGAKFVGGV